MRRAWIASALIAVVLAGCGGGGGDDQQSARDVAQAYVDANNARDFDRVCGLLSDTYEDQLKIGSNCPAFLGEQTSGAPRTLTLIGVQEKGDTATARIRSRASDQSTLVGNETALFVRDREGDWRLVALTAYKGK
jgi:ketosteroid isomerase-like protein